MEASLIGRHYLPAERLRAWILESVRPGLNSSLKIFFVDGCAGSSLLCMVFLSLTVNGGCFSSWCVGFTSWWLQYLWLPGSRAWAISVVHSSSSLLLCGMWDLPGPGIETLSPALAGRFLTTRPPGKPQDRDFNLYTQPSFILSLLFGFFQ